MQIADRVIRAADAVVLLVDLQKNLANMELTADSKALRQSISGLVKVAKVYELPIVVSTITFGGDLLSEVSSELKGVEPFVRQQTNALEDAPTVAAIEATGRKTLIVAGIVTEVAASMPALAAAKSGFTVALVYDACGGASKRSEHAALERLVQGGVIPLSVPQLIGEFVTDFGSEQGQGAMKILMSLLK